MGELSAFLSSFTWAMGTTVYARIAASHNAFAVNFTRALLALPLFFVMAVLLSPASAWMGLAPATIGWLALSVFASYGLGDAVFFLSAQRLGVPGALAISSTYPIWNALIGMAARGESLRAVQWAGLLVTVAFLIVVILTTPAGSRRVNVRGRALAIGLLLALLASLFWSLNSFSVSQAGRSVDPWVGNTIRMCFAALFTQVFGRLQSGRMIRPIPWETLRPVAMIFVSEAFLGSIFFLYGLAHSALAVGSTLTALAPVLAVPMAWIFGTEKIALGRLLGVSGVVFGLWLLVAA